MRKKLKPILNFLVLLCLVACGGGVSDPPLLVEAENCMNERPDSALLLLESIIHLNDLPKEQRPLWCLLYTQAQDKNRIEHTSDSLIQIAVKYYENSNQRDRKMQAYYYCGRVYQDLNRTLQAQEYYLKAYEIGKQLNGYSLMGRLCANLGTLYTFQELYRPALDFQKKSVDYFRQDRDSISLSLAFRNIARIYVCENRLDSAITYYLKALNLTSGDHNLYIYNELADAYRRVGDCEKGFLFARKAYSQVESTNDSCQVSLTLGDLYLKSGKIDSSYHFLSFCRKSTDIYTLKDTYHSLSQLEKARRNLNAYLVFQEQYNALRDSTDKQTYTETLTRFQYLYDYLLVEKEKEYYRQKADSNTIYIYYFLIGTILLLLLAVCFCWSFFSVKKKKEEQHDQLLRLQEQQARDSKKYQEERKAVILEMEQKTKMADGLKIELDMMKKVIDENISTKVVPTIIKEDQSRIFFASDLYRGLYSTWNKLDLEQWPEIVMWIDHILFLNFTYRIKMMYPSITDIDLQICCLTKLEIPVYRMAVLLSMTSQGISLRRKRLYKKLTQKEGSAQNFDEYILLF